MDSVILKIYIGNNNFLWIYKHFVWKNWVTLSHFKHTLFLAPYDPPLTPPGDPNFEIRRVFIASKVEF